MTTALTIPPLLRQHATDAAFYWQLLEYGDFSPTIDREKHDYFRRLLVAHLDGLRFAGDVGWQEALISLDDWQSAGEAFVATRLAFESGNEVRCAELASLLEQLDAQEVVPGVVSALKACADRITPSRLPLWLSAPQPLWRAAALELYGHQALRLDDILIHRCFDSDESLVRAAVCRYLAQMPQPQWLSHLYHACKDESYRVRQAAVWALYCARADDGGRLFPLVFEVLQHCLTASMPDEMNVPEWQRLIEFLARLSGQLLPAQGAWVSDALRRLPDYLRLLLLAHHGDPQYLPHIMKLMQQPELAPLAWWAFCFITGVDYDDDSYLIFDHLPAEEEQDEASEDITSHLVQLTEELYQPDPAAVACYLAAYRPAAARQLLGQPITLAGCRQILNDADASMLACLAARWQTIALERAAQVQGIHGG